MKTLTFRIALLTVIIAIVFWATNSGDRSGGVEQYSPRLKDIKQVQSGFYLYNKGSHFAPIFDTLSLRYKVIDTFAVYQGDIILGDIRKMDTIFPFADKRQGIKSFVTSMNGHLWDNKEVFYHLDISVKKWRATILEAIAEWENATDLRFTESTTTGDYINFKHGDGYASPIGKQGGEQVLYVDGDPEKGQVMHEIGHAIGLWHEHSRPDRDEFITVNKENIMENHVVDFDIQETDVSTAQTGYDYGSLMHYPRDAFAKSGNTIDPKDNTEIGQRVRLSETDKQGIRKLYN